MLLNILPKLKEIELALSSKDTPDLGKHQVSRCRGSKKVKMIPMLLRSFLRTFKKLDNKL